MSRIDCLLRHAVFVFAASLAVSSQAADLPKRKSGLWEIQTQMSGMPSGMPGQGPMQFCVDQASDDVLRERGDAGHKANCPVMEVKPGAGRMTVHAVCKENGLTTTIDAVMTGDFGKAYRNEMLSRFDPPQGGMREMRMVQEARWLGPCKAGQAPGMVMMPGMGGGNMEQMQQMMSDPRVREMLKQQGR